MANLSALDVEKICRVCLQSNLDLFLIFDESYSVDGIGISDMLSECTIHKVKRFDELPHLICNDCMGNVKNAFRFKKQCERSYRLLVELLEKRQSDEKKLIQTFCNTDVSSEKATQTEDTALNPCEKCDEKFFSYEALKEHRTNDHKGSANQCRFCLKTFNRIGYLKSHIAVFHPEIGCTSSNTCSVCEKQFTRKDHVRRHMVNVHKVKDPEWEEKNSLEEPEIEYTYEDDKYVEDICAALQSNIASISLPTPSSSPSSPTSACYDYNEEDNATLKKSSSEAAINSTDGQNDEKPHAKLLDSGMISNEIPNQLDVPTCHKQIKNEREEQLIFPLLDLVELKPEVENQENSITNVDSSFNDKQISAKEVNPLAAGSPIGGVKPIGKLSESIGDSKQMAAKQVNPMAVDSPIGDVKPIGKLAESIGDPTQIAAKQVNPLAADSPIGDSKPIGKLSESITDPNKHKYKCIQCNRTFNRSGHLKRHMLTHGDEKPFPCSICPKRFKRADHLKIHLKSHSEANFHCDECHHSFTRKEHLKRHKDLTHSGLAHSLKTEVCEVCSKSFTTKSYLRRHLLSHTDKRYSCRNCEKMFMSKENLKEHMKTHSNAKPFLCSECGARFVRNDYLLIHMRRHKGEKPYKCKFCNKGFPRATDLNVHERYHTGEKTHLCTICGKGFQRGYNLVVHMRVHTGERPYKCSHCPSSFAQGNDLKAHVRRHTGERFKCETCGCGFIQAYHLSQHMLTVHGIQVKPRTGRVTKFKTTQEQEQQIKQNLDYKFDPTIIKTDDPFAVISDR